MEKRTKYIRRKSNPMPPKVASKYDSMSDKLLVKTSLTIEPEDKYKELVYCIFDYYYDKKRLTMKQRRVLINLCSFSEER